jgi:hypothetical protein
MRVRSSASTIPAAGIWRKKQKNRRRIRNL